MFSAELRELHAPMKGTKEGEDNGPIGDLYVLEHVQIGEGVGGAQTGDGGQACMTVIKSSLGKGMRGHPLACSGGFAREEDGTNCRAEVGDGPGETCFPISSSSSSGGHDIPKAMTGWGTALNKLAVTPTYTSRSGFPLCFTLDRRHKKI